MAGNRATALFSRLNIFSVFGDEFAGRGFLIAVAVGWIIELAYGITAEPHWQASFRTFCLLWFASGAAFFVGTIGGFLFGVPKFASNPTSPSTATNASRFKINTNLEDVSDWLTKIILGLGLVHFQKVIHFIDSIGNDAATAIGPAQGAKLIAISSIIYGFVCGFIVVYVWTLTTLKEEFERAEGRN